MTKERSIGDVMRTIIDGNTATVILSTTEEVGIRVCDGYSLPKLLRFAAKVSGDLGLSLQDSEGIKDRLLAKVDDVSFILNLIANYTDDIYELAGNTTSLQSADAVKSLAIDDLLAVLIKIVEVNRDFFMNRVLPLLQGVLVSQGH